MKNAISDRLSSWLSYPGSFMQRLKSHGVENARIRIIREGWRIPFRDERNSLNIPCRTHAWIREVFICSDQTIWMFARTVIPQKTLTGKEQQLQHLKTRSLGSILFKHPEIQRSEFDYFCIEPGMRWHKKIARDLALLPDLLWARRSVFTKREKSLLLTEVFFPEISAL